MIQNLTKIINWFIKPYDYQTEIESYILSKQPTSVAEIDFWTRQYEFNKFSKGGWL